MPWTKWTEEQKFHKEFHVDLAHFHKTFLFLLLLIEENNTSQESREEEKEEGGGGHLNLMTDRRIHSPLHSETTNDAPVHTHIHTDTL